MFKMNTSIAMLLSNSLHYHRWLAKCTWVGALSEVARRLSVFRATHLEVSCRRMPVTSVFRRWHSIDKLLSVLFLDCVGILLVHR
jgi:hypothetical protein